LIAGTIHVQRSSTQCTTNSSDFGVL